MPTPTLTPQLLGRAENAHRAILERILEETAMTYEQWVALSVAAAGEEPPTDEVIARAAAALKVSRSRATAAVDALAAAGLLEEEPAKLTVAGQARFEQVRAAIGGVVGRLYAGIPADQLRIAGSVLVTITARADAELAG